MEQDNTRKKISKAKPTLPHRVIKGGGWFALLVVIKQSLNIVRLIIVARILSPSDFGIMGIALVLIAALDTISKTGFQEALIQKKDSIKEYLNTAWTVLIIRGIILYVILYILSPYVANFFAVPSAKIVIQVMGLTVFLQAAANIGVVYYKKELEFNKEFFYQISGTLVDFIVTVTIAMLFRNIWALVLGFVSGYFTRLIVSYVIHAYRPRLYLDYKKAKELFAFGKWVLASSIVIFLITQGDDIFVGKFLGATMLGFYQLAYRISNLPATQITHIMSQVTFPAYSKLQEDISKLSKAYLKVLQVTAFLSFPITGLIFILASDFTAIFLGQKWIPIVPVIQVLSVYGMFRSLGALPGNVVTALGKVKILPVIPIIQLVFIVLFIYPMAVKFQLMGVSIIVTFSVMVAVIYALKIGNKYLSLTFGKLLRILFPSITATIIMVASIGITNFFMNRSVILFIIKGVCGVAVYVMSYSLIIKQNVLRYFRDEYAKIRSY